MLQACGVSGCVIVFFFAGVTCIMLQFIKIRVTASLLLNCTNRVSHLYKMADRVFQLKLVYKSAVNDTVVCTAHDPEFSLRTCYLNSRLELSASASKNCITYRNVDVTCKDRGMLLPEGRKVFMKGGGGLSQFTIENVIIGCFKIYLRSMVEFLKL